MVLSTIGLSQPGKIERGARAAGCSNHLHQLHACLPSSPGRTKLLYRWGRRGTCAARGSRAWEGVAGGAGVGALLCRCGYRGEAAGQAGSCGRAFEGCPQPGLAYHFDSNRSHSWLPAG